MANSGKGPASLGLWRRISGNGRPNGRPFSCGDLSHTSGPTPENGQLIAAAQCNRALADRGALSRANNLQFCGTGWLGERIPCWSQVAAARCDCKFSVCSVGHAANGSVSW